MKSVFPRREGDFNGWSNRYSEVIAANPNQYFLTGEEVTHLQQLQADWDKTYADSIAASDQARAAMQAKNDARDALEQMVRSTAKRIMADDRITDVLRKDAGLPVHKTTRTPVPVPVTAPMGHVVGTDRLEHSILVTDAQTPTKRRKPAGVIGCETFLLIRDLPSFDPDEYKLIGLWTRYPEVVDFEAEDAGKTAHYLFRWFNTKGEKGPWSDVTSATIPSV